MIPAVTPEHLLIAPLLIPFAAGVLMLFYDDRRRWLKFGIGLVSVMALAAVSWQLLGRAGEDAVLRVYLLGNWPVPMGIVLVLDRLAAMMVMLTAALALPALIHAAAGWQGQGQHFHSLFQFLLLGLNGAFLTGDIFNLFVFFEVMLAASYGLVLHGSGVARIRAGLNYIAVNLTASLLFLIGVALIYGVTGTLNMAQLSQVSPTLGPGARPLFNAGAAILGIAFLIKAAIWPMGFWLARTYAAAAPVGAMLAIMSKVGVYAVLRLAMLCFGPAAGAAAGFGGPVLLLAGMATIVYGAVGVLASSRLAMRAGHVVLISSGTLIGVIGFALLAGGERMLGGALFYLVGSTLAASALYFIAEMVDRHPAAAPEVAAPEPEPEREIDWGPMGLGAVEDDDAPATALPATLVTVAALFATVTVILAGLPPFSGFVGKFAMVSGMIAEASGGDGLPGIVWLFILVLVGSGFAVLVALLHFGIARFWVAVENPPRILVLEVVPVAILLGALVLLTFRADAAMRLTLEAAEGLIEGRYAATVMSVRPVDPADAPDFDTGDAAP